MADDERNALVIQGPRSLAEVGAGPRNILSNVVSDALTVARSRETALSAARFQIGRYEFCEPDYSQILIWAKALEIDPEAFVQQLEKTSFTQRARSLYRSEARDISEVTTTVFKVERGAIVSLAWDFFHLRIKTFDWVSGLSIQAIAVFDQFALDYAVISFSLPFLRSLFIGPIHLTKVDSVQSPGAHHTGLLRQSSYRTRPLGRSRSHRAVLW